MPPPGLSATTVVTALMRQPDGETYWLGTLLPAGGHRYRSEEAIRLPLQPLAGMWRVVVIVKSSLPVAGPRALFFEPQPIPTVDFSADPTFRPGVELALPREFTQTAAWGAAWAGYRVWRAEGGEIGLWWAPGPTEALALNTAVVMLEATYDPAMPPRWLEVVETEWDGQRAYLFREAWAGPEGGPGESLVVRGPDLWLYVLRVRALGAEQIPELVRMVRDTFGFAEPQ